MTEKEVSQYLPFLAALFAPSPLCDDPLERPGAKRGVNERRAALGTTPMGKETTPARTMEESISPPAFGQSALNAAREAREVHQAATR